MMKRLYLALIGLVCAGGIAFAANLPLVTGAQDPSQLQAVVNGVIQTINTAVSRIGVGSTSVATTTGGETVLYQYTLPPGLLANAGDSIRTGCWGTTATNSDTKSFKLYFGGTSISSPVQTGTSNKGWRLQMTVMRRTAGGQSVDSWGLVDTTAVTPANADAAETLANAITIKCTGTGTLTAGDIVGQGMLVEAIR